MLTGDDLKYFYEYIAELMGRQVFSHEIPALSDDLKEKAEPDFIRVCARATGVSGDTVELHKVSSRPKSEQYVCISCGKFCYYPHCKAGIQYRFCPNCGREVRGYA
jgi:hypothetical protein